MKDKKKTKKELTEDVKQLESRIKELESEQSGCEDGKYHRLFNKIADPIFIFAKDSYRFLDCNEAVLKIYGYTKEELKSMTPFDLHDPADLERMQNRTDEDDEKEMDMFSTYTHITKYGQKIDVEVLSDEISYDGQPALISIVRDVTHRKKAEDELLSSQRELEKRVKERTIELERINEQLQNEVKERKYAEEKLNESFAKLRKTLDGIVKAMATMGDARDPYTAGHQRRVAELASAIAREMEFSDDEVECVRIAGLLHDIGKISIPAEILSKPGRLTEIEYSFIKNHPQVSYDILKDIEFPWPIADIVLQHHERLDGSGYPRGLKRKDIRIEARILAVADVVEAMSSHRPYRPAPGINKAFTEILENRGVLYEPEVVNACLRLFAEKKFEFN